MSYTDNFSAGSYKFTSIQIFRRFDTLNMSRTTYDFLNYFGDIGGLIGVLKGIGIALVGFIQTYLANSFLLSRMYFSMNEQPSD